MAKFVIVVSEIKSEACCDPRGCQNGQIVALCIWIITMLIKVDYMYISKLTFVDFEAI